jgi:hypothetical protein
VLNAHPHGNVLSKINDGRWDPLVRDLAALDESTTGAAQPQRLPQRDGRRGYELVGKQ